MSKLAISKETILHMSEAQAVIGAVDLTRFSMCLKLFAASSGCTYCERLRNIDENSIQFNCLN